jgi:hypothetical protein
MSNRRGFLKLLGMAPVAGPVAAKEAAASMGLEGVIAGASMVGGAIPSGSPISTGDNLDWLKDRIREHVSGEIDADYKANARHDARRLDPDLAALRSVSPAWAYTQQVERAYQRNKQIQETWLSKTARKAGLFNLLGSGR